ncbi:uncharacterized protein LOC133635339 isoform X2 [Entelurus aequoreus]|uniref:uncharacterized protein LOC133635339 isoform X2 n=1 Tax=Entelurus aequoreus TaxID=161455 RepID=UPI002B1DC3A8|nr:uncharacterized protein LOC133635339 isoform X2 [Entelurus aequoreus]
MLMNTIQQNIKIVQLIIGVKNKCMSTSGLKFKASSVAVGLCHQRAFRQYASPMECKQRSLGTQTEQKDHFTSITTSTMDVLSTIRLVYSNDVAEMLEQILPMLPSSFSVEEANLYQEEKLLLRQFVIMKQLLEVPSYVSVEHMKQWILSRRSFLEEFQGFDVKMNRKMFCLLESAWISARCVCLNKMEKEVWEDIREEVRLSQLLGKSVTLEGFHMFLLVVCPKAEEEVEWFLGKLFNSSIAILTTWRKEWWNVLSASSWISRSLVQTLRRDDMRLPGWRSSVCWHRHCLAAPGSVPTSLRTISSTSAR